MGVRPHHAPGGWRTALLPLLMVATLPGAHLGATSNNGQCCSLGTRVWKWSCVETDVCSARRLVGGPCGRRKPTHRDSGVRPARQCLSGKPYSDHNIYDTCTPSRTVLHRCCTEACTMCFMNLRTCPMSQHEDNHKTHWHCPHSYHILHAATAPKENCEHRRHPDSPPHPTSPLGGAGITCFCCG
jgi:hypothetical protein